MLEKFSCTGDGIGRIPSGSLAFDGSQTGHLWEEVGRHCVGADLAGRQIANRRRELLCFQGKKEVCLWLGVRIVEEALGFRKEDLC